MTLTGLARMPDFLRRGSGWLNSHPLFFTLLNIKEVMLGCFENENSLDKRRKARVTPNQGSESGGFGVECVSVLCVCARACAGCEDGLPVCAGGSKRALARTDLVPKQAHTGSLQNPARALWAPGETVRLPAGLGEWDLWEWWLRSC